MNLTCNIRQQFIALFLPECERRFYDNMHADVGALSRRLHLIARRAGVHS